VAAIEADECIAAGRSIGVEQYTAAAFIGEVWFVAGYITGPLPDIMAAMGSPAATIPIRHARLDIMAAFIAVVSRSGAVAFTAADPSIEAVERE
jgi:hypothetical protein